VGKLKVGFVGAGSMARRYLNEIEGMTDVEAIGIADIDDAKARDAAEHYGIPHVFSRHEELLGIEELEAVHVCTPNMAHREPAVAAMRSGKHVFVEKPIAATLDDAAQIVETAKKTGRVLFCSLHTRYNSPVMVARDIVAQGVLGHIYYGEAVISRRRGIPPRPSFVKKSLAGMGALADIGIYSLDTALHLMGYPRPVAVAGCTSSVIGTTQGPPKLGSWAKWDPKEIEVEEFASAWIRFEDATVLVLKASWAVHMDSLGSTFLLGTKAGLRLEPELTVMKDEWGYMVDITPKGVTSIPWTTRLNHELTDFYASIREGTPPPIDPSEVLVTSVIFDGILRSVEAGGCEVPLTYPEL
jgi:predicted dehydrogenase